MHAQVDVVRAGTRGSDSQCLSFGPLDRLYINMRLIVDIGMIYEGAIDVERLRQAISASLVEFWPVSGRLRSTELGDVVIEGCDAGVWFSCQIIDDPTLPPPEYPLDVTYFNRVPDPAPHEPDPALDREFPLLSVKLTKLGTQGFVLGVSIAHIVADLRSTYDLVRSWAQLYNDPHFQVAKKIHNRHLLYQHLKETHHDPAHEEESRRLLNVLVPQQQPAGMFPRAMSMVEELWEVCSLHRIHPMSVVSFVISDSDIGERKKLLLEEQNIMRGGPFQKPLDADPTKATFLSRNDVLNAMVLDLIDRATGYRQRYQYIALVLQMRSLLHLENYFGNAVHQECFPHPRTQVAATLRAYTNKINDARYLSWRANSGQAIPAPLDRRCITLNSWSKGFSLAEIAFGAALCVDVNQLGSCGGDNPQDGFWAQRALSSSQSAAAIAAMMQMLPWCDCGARSGADGRVGGT